jgi:hypothetical protein
MKKTMTPVRTRSGSVRGEERQHLRSSGALYSSVSDYFLSELFIKSLIFTSFFCYFTSLGGELFALVLALLFSGTLFP